MIVLATARHVHAERAAVAAVLLPGDVPEVRLRLVSGESPLTLLRRPLDVPEDVRGRVADRLRERTLGYAVICGPAQPERQLSMVVLAVCRTLERARSQRRVTVESRDLVLLHAELPAIPSCFVGSAKQRRRPRFGDWRCGVAWLLAAEALAMEATLCGTT